MPGVGAYSQGWGLLGQARASRRPTGALPWKGPEWSHSIKEARPSTGARKQGRISWPVRQQTEPSRPLCQGWLCWGLQGRGRREREFYQGSVKTACSTRNDTQVCKKEDPRVRLIFICSVSVSDSSVRGAILSEKQEVQEGWECRLGP